MSRTKRGKKTDDDAPKSSKSRKRSLAEVEDAEAAGDQAVSDDQKYELPETTAATKHTERRIQMAEIAQRRAAHFATFRTEDDEENANENVHVGGDEACKLGPWSSARELVAQREAAAEARKERMLAGETQRPAEALSWKPRSNWETVQRPKERSVQPLADLCVNIIADYVDCVESLVGLPQIYVNAIAKGAAHRRKVDNDVWQLFTEGGPSEVVLPNCTAVNESTMLKGIKEACTVRLEMLDLGFCGHGFGDPAADALAAAGPLPALKCLRLTGAYRLHPPALLKAVKAAPNITRLEVPHCTCLEGPEMLQIAEALPNLQVLNVSGCRGLEGSALAEGLKAMKKLEAVYLSVILSRQDEVESVTDTVLSALASPSLQVLHVRRCRSITDEGISQVATAATSLADVDLAETPITSACLERLASQCLSLHALCVRQCKKVKDEVPLISIAHNGSLRTLDVGLMDVVSSALMLELAESCNRTLQTLSLDFCRNVPPQAVGMLLDACRELACLNVFGCSQLTKAALRGHRNERVVVHGEPTFDAGTDARPVDPMPVKAAA